MFKNLLEKQYLRLAEQEWESLYFVVDVHGVILKPDIAKRADEFYPLAKETLQMLSDRDDVILIMWTASKEEDRKKYLDFFAESGIVFKYCNENPEIPELTTWGDYRTKMYTNVGLDDKFLFEYSRLKLKLFLFWVLKLL